MDLKAIIDKMDIKYYENIIKYLNKTSSKINYNFIYDILKRYEKIEKQESNTETETSPLIQNKSIILGTDDSHFKKSWSKLNNIHKIIKIKEWVNNLSIDDIIEKEKLKEELVNLVKMRILTKKEKVIYDEKEGKIKSIVDLIYKDNHYYYPITK